MIVNPFMVLAALLMASASAWALWGGNYKTGLLYALYAAANGVLSTLRG